MPKTDVDRQSRQPHAGPHAGPPSARSMMRRATAASMPDSACVPPPSRNLSSVERRWGACFQVPRNDGRVLAGRSHSRLLPWPTRRKSGSRGYGCLRLRALRFHRSSWIGCPRGTRAGSRHLKGSQAASRRNAQRRRETTSPSPHTVGKSWKGHACFAAKMVHRRGVEALCPEHTHHSLQSVVRPMDLVRS